MCVVAVTVLTASSPGTAALAGFRLKHGARYLSYNFIWWSSLRPDGSVFVSDRLDGKFVHGQTTRIRANGQCLTATHNDEVPLGKWATSWDCGLAEAEETWLVRGGPDMITLESIFFPGMCTAAYPATINGHYYENYVGFVHCPGPGPQKVWTLVAA